MKEITTVLLLIFSSTIYAQSPLPKVTAEALDFGCTTYNQGQAFTAITVDNNAKVWAKSQEGIFTITLPVKSNDDIPIGKPSGNFSIDTNTLELPNFQNNSQADLSVIDDLNIPTEAVINNSYRNKKKLWVTLNLTDQGFYVHRDRSWLHITPNTTGMEKVIPPNTYFNDAAVWGNDYGNVFMGTNNGLLVYDGRGAVYDPTAYTLYSKTDIIPGSPFVVVNPNMVSNMITGGSSQYEGAQWISTDNGIMRMKIGHIKTDPKVLIADTKWRRRYRFCGDNYTTQYLSSVRWSKNPTIRNVELAIDAGFRDETYHCYQIETTIYDPKKTRGNKAYATVENVFHMLKEYAFLQAVTPLDFPEEVPGDDFLREIDQTQVMIFEGEVNKETERIKKIEDIMRKNSYLSEFDVSAIENNGGFYYLGAYTTTFDISVFAFQMQNVNNLVKLQIQENNKRVIHETAEYKLYNVPKAFTPRKVFDANYTLPFVPDGKSIEKCEGDGIESIFYDPVIMHIDDTNYTIINYTKPGHYFHPGKITRTVVRDPDTGEVYVRTVGEGEHFCKGELGELSGKLNTIMGTILFKNLDIRLRETFNNL